MLRGLPILVSWIGQRGEPSKKAEESQCLPIPTRLMGRVVGRAGTHPLEKHLVTLDRPGPLAYLSRPVSPYGASFLVRRFGRARRRTGMCRTN
jgi:hypothetical protein